MTPFPSFGLLSSFALLSISVAVNAQTKASCSFKLFELPESTYSIAYGINDSGTVVGSTPTSSTAKGFVRTASGKVSYYCAPEADCSNYSSYTYFTGLNDAGVDVGIYKIPGAGSPQGFKLNGSTFTAINDPNAAFGTAANGINKSNTVVGYYYDSGDHLHGFQRSSDGRFLTLDFPDAQNTSPQAINDKGTIVGYYTTPAHGFIHRNATWATLDYPGASTTVLNGISDADVIVGNGYVKTPTTAFLYENGDFKVIAVPNAYSTSVSGISSNGLIVGETNLNNTQAGLRGFTATCK